MRMIIAPAKRLRTDADGLSPAGVPALLHRTRRLLEALRAMDLPALQRLLACSADIARLNYERFQSMNLDRADTPAILAYDGIQYQYMAPQVFDRSCLDYVQAHLRILSGFYGVLRPLDAVVPYRLEMQAKLALDGCRNLYQFWGDSLAQRVTEGDNALLNLASEEYAKAVRRHLPNGVRWIDCIFGELEESSVREKGVYVKMARGEAVRFLAENQLQSPDDLRAFDRLGFSWSKAHSDENRFVFLMRGRKHEIPESESAP